MIKLYQSLSLVSPCEKLVKNNIIVPYINLVGLEACFYDARQTRKYVQNRCMFRSESKKSPVYVAWLGTMFIVLQSSDTITSIIFKHYFDYIGTEKKVHQLPDYSCQIVNVSSERPTHLCFFFCLSKVLFVLLKEDLAEDLFIFDLESFEESSLSESKPFSINSVTLFMASFLLESSLVNNEIMIHYKDI